MRRLEGMEFNSFFTVASYPAAVGYWFPCMPAVS